MEATELSEGRGTCRPFEVAGAPGVDPERLAVELARRDFPGCRFRPLYFRPKFQKHAGGTCGGVQIHITDRRRFDSCAVGAAFLQSVKRVAPEVFAWREKPYEFVTDIPAIDLLAGDDKLRLALKAGADLNDLAAEWARERAAFEDVRQTCLLYTSELNLIEIRWHKIKYEWFPLRAYLSFDHLQSELQNILDQVGSKYKITFG